jgi:hypothetical protein
MEFKMKNTKSTYLIIQLEIKKEADIDDIIMDLRGITSKLVEHPDIKESKIIGSSDGLIFD